MKKSTTYIALISTCLLFSACKHTSSSSPYIKVYKSDGSIQCENTGVELNTMALELTNVGIDVICAQKGHDGLMRAAVCGADTGNLNIYEINSVNLPDAEPLGFKPVYDLSEYQDQKCE